MAQASTASQPTIPVPQGISVALVVNGLKRELEVAPWTTLLDLLRDQKIHPHISERLPLREAQRAHELIENARVTGKIVLLCQE